MAAFFAMRGRQNIFHSIILLASTFSARPLLAQTAPFSPDRPWHSAQEREIASEAARLSESRLGIEPDRTYSLAELIDLAEAHNPETRVAWERARAQVAASGVARSELYPTLAAAALSQTDRFEILLGPIFARETTQSFGGTLDLRYLVFDFGGRSGRIGAAAADVLASNFAFNDTHRRIIFQAEQTYYRLLNASGQEVAARASLTNAETVQQSAEERLKQGLATLPDVLEASSATALARYELQAVLGAEDIARGDLAAALGDLPNVAIHPQPLERLSIPDSVEDTVDQAIQRAFCGTSRSTRAVGRSTIGSRQGEGGARGFLSQFGIERGAERPVAVWTAAGVSLGLYGGPERRVSCCAELDSFRWRRTKKSSGAGRGECPRS
jgi:outer membrane protein TolC